MDSRIVLGLTLIALPIAFNVLSATLALVLGSLEFVGRSGSRGWSVAEKAVPFAYLGWSIWLLALGVTYPLDIHVA